MFKIFLVISFFSSSLIAQNSTFDSLVTSGIDQIYNIKFEEAEKTFDTLIAEYPDHPAGMFFHAMIDWWKILLLELDDKRYDDVFYEKIENVISFCDQILKRDKKNVDALFFKGGAIGFRGRLRVMRESWLKAADDGRTALPIVEEAGNLDPDNLDVQLGFGIYNYYAAVIPENFPIVKPLMLFFPSGDINLGIKQLKSTATRGKYAKHEARYFLMTLYYTYEKDYVTAKLYSNMLTKSFPDNPVFERWRGRIAVRNGEWALADSIFKNVYRKAENNLYGYNTLKVKREAAYYIGYQFRRINQADSALIYFKKCIDYASRIKGQEDSGFLINSTLYAGMIYEAQKNYTEAKKYYEKVVKMKDYGNSREVARMNLKRVNSSLKN
jgi:tetratricopeptide (TPR) repeat protein